MTKSQIEDRLRILLAVESSSMFYRDGDFTIYSPIGRTACQGTGKTIQQAIFGYDYNRSRISVFVSADAPVS